MLLNTLTDYTLPRAVRVIAIQNYGTSGTTLMHSLLDNHPQVMSMPYLHSLPLYRVWNDFLKDKRPLTFEHIKTTILREFPLFFDVTQGGDPSLTRLGLDKNQRVEVSEVDFFRHLAGYFSGKSPFTRRDFVVSVYLAWNRCFGESYADPCYLCYPIHSQPRAYAKQLVADFPHVFFLHMIREPVQNMGSLMKHIDTNQMKNSLFKGTLTCAVSQILCRKSLHWEQGKVHDKTYCKVPYFGESEQIQSRFVRLEDVHRSPEATLQKVSHWLGIDFHPCLLESTFQGLAWHNRSESQSVSGFNQSIVRQQHHRYLNRFDKYRLRLLAHSEADYFGYYQSHAWDPIARCFLPILLLLPFQSEFSTRRLKYRLRAMMKAYSKDDKSSILEWVLKDYTYNTYPGSLCTEMPIATKTRWQRLSSLLPALPAYIYRILYNYAHLRTLMLSIWWTQRLPSKVTQYVKPL